MKVGTIAPTPGMRPSTKPDARAAADGAHGLPPLGLAVGIQLLSSASTMCGLPLLGGEQKLGDAEQAHDHGHEADAVVEFLDAEGEARGAAHRIDADHGEQEPDHRHEQGGQHVVAGEAARPGRGRPP